MIGLLSLYYHWRRGQWRGWASVGQMVGEGVVWGAVAWLTFTALFPAMWVIPGEVISRLIEMSFGMAEEGHEADQYFLGSISHDPGPLLLSHRLVSGSVAAGGSSACWSCRWPPGASFGRSARRSAAGGFSPPKGSRASGTGGAGALRGHVPGV